MASQISCQPPKPPMKPPIRLTAENRIYKYWILERETGFEPATLALARRCSTTELFPLDHNRSEGWDSTDARTKLSSNQVGPAHHCYLVTFVTIAQPCYRMVTHEYYYQVFDLLHIYSMK